MKEFFSNNGFPTTFFEKRLKVFLDKTFINRKIITSVPKEKLFAKLPYFGQDCEVFYRDLKKFLSHSYPQLDFHFILVNNFSIGTFFKTKENLPFDLRSNVIYKYEGDVCQSSYIGSTSKQSKVRFSQHFGISHRTSLPLSSQIQSSIRDHCLEEDHRMKTSNFSILKTTSNPDLRILESLYIKSMKPNLNKDMSSHKLNII